MKFLALAALSLIFVGGGCIQTQTSSETEIPSPAVSAGTILDLSNQGLTEVSQDILKKTNLVSLDISHNRLTGSLPAEIRQLTKLQVLDASDNAMTGVPAEIGQLKNLQTLDLSNNQLTGLPLELGQLTQLKLLDLRGNDVSTYDLDQIRQSLTNTQILVD